MRVHNEGDCDNLEKATQLMYQISQGETQSVDFFGLLLFAAFLQNTIYSVFDADLSHVS